MPVTGPIPLPNTSKWGDFSDILQNLQQQRLQRQQMESMEPLRKAQTALAQSKANLPFGGQIPPGPAGQTVGLEMVKNLYGENSPQYKQAKDAFDLNQRSNLSRANYQDILSNSAPKRFSTTEGKRAQEQQDIEEGYMPGSTIGNQPGKLLTPEQQDKLKGQYSNKVLKDTTDPNVRQRILYARNMEQTLQGINPDDLTVYSGPKGHAQLVKDYQESLTGIAPDRLLKYKEAITAANALSKQVRQFYGDSITAGVQEGLKSLTNPTGFLTAPSIAKAKFMYFRDKILLPEAKNFYSAAKSANIYEEPKESFRAKTKNTSSSENNQPIAILYKDGKEYHMPPKLVQKALREGFTLGD